MGQNKPRELNQREIEVDFVPGGNSLHKKKKKQRRYTAYWQSFLPKFFHLPQTFFFCSPYSLKYLISSLRFLLEIIRLLWEEYSGFLFIQTFLF